MCTITVLLEHPEADAGPGPISGDAGGSVLIKYLHTCVYLLDNGLLRLVEFLLVFLCPDELRGGFQEISEWGHGGCLSKSVRHLVYETKPRPDVCG